jgi:outer membrane protein assembly factor BamB
MKKLLCGLVALVGLTATATPQSDVRVITHPVPPNREVQDRLSLRLAWRTKLKLENSRDGIFSVQILPSKAGPQILVQTLAGNVVLLDAETGDALWRMALPGKVLQPVGFNDQSIFVARADTLFILSRKNGLHRLFIQEKDYPEPTYGFPLPGTPSAAIAADEDGMFVAMGLRVTGYALPDFELAAQAQAKQDKEPAQESDNAKTEEEKKTSLQPQELWTFYSTTLMIEQSPLITHEKVNVVTADGHVLYKNRFEQLSLPLDFKLPGNVSAPMNRYGLTMFVGSDDYTLYAMDMHVDQIFWRFLSGAPIYRKPEVTDAEIFVTADRVGMYRLVRETGRETWLNARAEQFLATNGKFVYALDRKGQLLILDALRGATLATWDARDWTLALSNEWTDRLYLAAQDGQIMCLHHRDVPAPLKIRTIVPIRPEEVKKPITPKKEDVETKVEEKKEDKKEEKKEEKKKKDDKAEPKIGRLPEGLSAPVLPQWDSRERLSAARVRPRDPRAWPLI